MTKFLTKHFVAPQNCICVELMPVFDELSEMLTEEDVAIVKMNSSGNDVLPLFKTSQLNPVYPTAFLAAARSPQAANSLHRWNECRGTSSIYLRKRVERLENLRSLRKQKRTLEFLEQTRPS